MYVTSRLFEQLAGSGASTRSVENSRSLAVSLFARCISNLGLKLILLALVPTTSTVIYFIIQRNILFHEWKMPRTFLDTLIPFQPHWVWVYLSLYVMAVIGPLFTRSREKLLRYAAGVTLYNFVAFICFVLIPVAAPRPAQARGDWLYEHMIQYDGLYNSVPSLHAACAVFAVLYAAYASRDTSRPRLRIVLLVFLWIWVGLILYSTIATRQILFFDLPPGMVLGWLTLYLVVKLPAPFVVAVSEEKDGGLKAGIPTSPR